MINPDFRRLKSIESYTYPVPKSFEEFKAVYIDPDLIESMSGSDTRYLWFNTLYRLYRKKLPKNVKEFILKNQLKLGYFRGNVSICPNIFPYLRLLSHSRIKHFVVWQIQPSSIDGFDNKPYMESLIRDWLHKNGYSRNHAFVLYKNSDRRKSIKDVEHWQLFVSAKSKKV